MRLKKGDEKGFDDKSVMIANSCSLRLQLIPIGSMNTCPAVNLKKKQTRL